MVLILRFYHIYGHVGHPACSPKFTNPLHEIVALQPKLMRVLQEQEFERLRSGSDSPGFLPLEVSSL